MATVETIPGTKAVGERLARAEINFVETLVTFGKITEDEAWKVFALYRKLRVVKRKGCDRWEVVHGGFLSKATIRRALAQARSKTK